MTSSESPKVLGVTLARSGSKGVPGKNTRLLAGIPLLGHTVIEAQKATMLSNYVVSTDSSEIATIAKDLGAWVPFLRPLELASDVASSAAALQHAVTRVEDLLKVRFDFVVELMATNPFKVAKDIDNAITTLIDSGADTVIAVKRVLDEHPARVKKIVNGFIQDFCVEEKLESRRQDLEPEAFIRCGAIYAMTRSELMDAGRRYGSSRSIPFELEYKNSINIDSENDFLLAEILLSRMAPKWHS